MYQDDRLVVIDKPAGHHVHPPEVNPAKVPRDKIVLYGLRDQIQKKLYPIHRLDAGTSGILAFALDSEAASLCARQFQNHAVQKAYWALVRGFTEEAGRIDLELESDSTHIKRPAQTLYRKLGQIELEAKVGKKFARARYSWLEVNPLTGRFHQIRRHMNRISHPVIGDSSHGDSRHNTFFREQLGIRGLCLRSISLEMELPWQSQRKVFSVSFNPQWEKIKSLFVVSGAGSGG